MLVSSRSDWDLSERSEEHTSELQSPCNLVCRLLLEKKKKKTDNHQPLSEPYRLKLMKKTHRSARLQSYNSTPTQHHYGRVILTAELLVLNYARTNYNTATP